MTPTPTASQQITDKVTAWPGITSGYGRRGEFAFKYGGKEIGHLHGDHAAHFFFGEDLFTELFAEGRIAHHPVFPDRNGPAARRIESEDDVRDVIELMRLNYERVTAASAARSRALATKGPRLCN
jgi:Family of unknown function (DUF5519)